MTRSTQLSYARGLATEPLLGEPGEFCTRGHSVMLGHRRMPGRTAEVIDAARCTARVTPRDGVEPLTPGRRAGAGTGTA